MNKLSMGLLGGLLVLMLGGCATEKPVLYARGGGTPPDGRAAIAQCQDQARAAGLRYHQGRVGTQTAENAAVGGAAGAAGGAIYGDAGRGAAVGAAGGVAAGLVRDLFHHGQGGPAPAYRHYVDQCLHERGYHPVGWQ